MKHMLFQTFGTLMQQAQCDMLREQARKFGRPDPVSCDPGQGGGFHTAPPAPPDLPPLPTPDRQNEWRR